MTSKTQLLLQNLRFFRWKNDKKPSKKYKKVKNITTRSFGWHIVFYQDLIIEYILIEQNIWKIKKNTVNSKFKTTKQPVFPNNQNIQHYHYVFSHLDFFLLIVLRNKCSNFKPLKNARKISITLFWHFHVPNLNLLFCWP